MKTKKCSLSIITLIAMSLILTTNPCHAYFGENSSQAPSGHKMAAIIAGSAIAGIAGLVLAFGNFFGKNNPSKDTVTYNPNGADSGTVPVDPNVYDDGATPKVLDNPGKLGKTGFKHMGWSDAPNATVAQYKTGENLTALSSALRPLYAVFGAGVTYEDTSGATGAPPVDDNLYTEGSSVIAPEKGTLEKSNYSFQGWSLTKKALSSDYRPGDPIIIPATGDLTLYSVWSVKPYGVNYYANGATAGSVPADNQYYNSGDTATILGNTGNLVKTGFHFLGWSINNPNASAPDYIAGSLPTITGSLNLYAVWTCNIIYNANGNNITGSVPTDSNNYTSGGLAPIASQGNLTNQGYYFKNWSNNSSAIVGNYIPGTNTIMTGDLNLFAIWNKKPYSVTYYPNGATIGDVPVATTYYDINDVAKARGNDAQVPLANPGFSFLGWSNNPNAATPQYVAGDNISFATATNGIVDLFAVWVCKIAYDSNGGIGNVTPDPTNYIRNSTAILSSGTGVTKPNYHISGWTNGNTSNNYNLNSK